MQKSEALLALLWICAVSAGAVPARSQGAAMSFVCHQSCSSLRIVARPELISRRPRVSPLAGTRDRFRGLVIEKQWRPLFPDRDARVAFTKKVYGVLSGQLSVTALAIWSLQGNEDICRLLLSQSGLWVMVVAFVSSLSSAIALLFHQPFILSLALLAVFTGGESLLVRVIASQYTAQSVLLALGSTLTAVVGLTTFSFEEYDLTLYGSSLLSALIIFVSTLFAWFCFHIPLSNAAVGGIGAVLFSIFMIYDIQQRIFKEGMLRENEYIRGAIELYTDIINIFVNVLKVAGTKKSDKDD